MTHGMADVSESAQAEFDTNHDDDDDDTDAVAANTVPLTHAFTVFPIFFRHFKMCWNIKLDIRSCVIGERTK